MFQASKGIRLNSKLERIEFKGDSYPVKLSEGTPEGWAKGMNMLVRILSVFLVWMKDDQAIMSLRRDKEENEQII